MTDFGPDAAGTVPVNDLMAFMTGERQAEMQRTVDDATSLVGRTEADIAEMLRLSDALARGTTSAVASALAELFTAQPALAESPIIPQLIAGNQPQHFHTPLLDACIEADVPAYLHGEASSGKSKAAKIAGEKRGMEVRAVSVNPQSSKMDFLGYMDGNGHYNTSAFRQIFEHGGIFLFDEIDNGNPGILALMNRALADFDNEFPDGNVTRSWSTRIMAAANTIGKGATAEYVGRNPIDAATLDRFAMIPWDIDAGLEEMLMKVPVVHTDAIDIAEGGIPTRQEWLDEVRGYRERAAAKNMHTVISSRAAIYGAKLAEQGVGTRWLEEMLIFKGATPANREKLAA